MLHLDKLDDHNAIYITARGQKSMDEVEAAVRAIKPRLEASDLRRLLLDISLCEYLEAPDAIMEKYIEVGENLPAFQIAIVYRKTQRAPASLVCIGFRRSGHSCERFETLVEALNWFSDAAEQH
ncbi:hypothetical protein [Woodsholea maritima]|uniref:hypothetical protein n=1 Tax=Woodsholea maritima TaxID=240237 RepID=UPI000377F3E5|nr:hypothetical protein [Woodsholea maritima]